MLFRVIMILDGEELDSNENINLYDNMSDQEVIDTLVKAAILVDTKVYFLDRVNSNRWVILHGGKEILAIQRNKRIIYS